MKKAEEIAEDIAVLACMVHSCDEHDGKEKVTSESVRYAVISALNKHGDQRYQAGRVAGIEEALKIASNYVHHESTENDCGKTGSVNRSRRLNAYEICDALRKLKDGLADDAGERARGK